MEMLGPLCMETVNLETDAKTLYYSLLKLKYSPCILFKVQKKTKDKYASLNNSRRNHMNRIFYQKIFESIDHSLRPTGCIS